MGGYVLVLHNTRNGTSNIVREQIDKIMAMFNENEIVYDTRRVHCILQLHVSVLQIFFSCKFAN